MSKLILCVDDSFTILMSLKTTLEMNGYAVESASDGLKALEKLAGGIKPEMIITDVNMPYMGGLELIRKVRALPGFRFVPILTFTTESQAALRDEGKKAGATGWIEKTANTADLLKVVKQLLP